MLLFTSFSLSLSVLRIMFHRSLVPFEFRIYIHTCLLPVCSHTSFSLTCVRMRASTVTWLCSTVHTFVQRTNTKEESKIDFFHCMPNSSMTIVRFGSTTAKCSECSFRCHFVRKTFSCCSIHARFLCCRQTIFGKRLFIEHTLDCRSQSSWCCMFSLEKTRKFHKLSVSRKLSI